MILPLCGALVRPHLEYSHSSGLPSQGRHGHSEENPAKGHRDEQIGACLLWGKAGTAVTAQPEEEKAQGELSNVLTHLKGGCKEDGARPLSVVPNDRTRCNGPNLKYGRFPLNIRKHIFKWEWPRSGTVFPGVLCSYHPYGNPKATSTWSGMTGSGWLRLGRGAGLGDLQRSFTTSPTV